MQNTNSRKIIYDTIKERFNFEIERIKLLDDKANNLVSIASILAALISGFAILSMKLSSISIAEIGTFALFLISLFLLIASLCYSILAYQIRNYVMIPDPPKLIAECEKMSADTILEVLYVNYTLATEENEKKNETKVFYVKRASWLLFAAVIMFAVFVFTIIART